MRQIPAIAVTCALASACTFYRPEPLPTAPDLGAAPAVLPGHALSMTEVAALAVERSPELRALRRKEEVSRAQAFPPASFPIRSSMRVSISRRCMESD